MNSENRGGLKKGPLRLMAEVEFNQEERLYKYLLKIREEYRSKIEEEYKGFCFNREREVFLGKLESQIINLE